MIIGTAGHIDHGKSALVEALTGSRMDRLREERERGITIDLNFAPYRLPDGTTAGVVDVPGHEDFVRTMVAGATGIDLVLLVIAADEGIKPQTREHLAIVEQLGIPRGIPVITKADLVADESAGLVEMEIAEWLRSSVTGFGPPVRVSAQTGMGLERLAAEIARLAGEVPPRRADDLFRLPVDRAFSVAGIGTVVTGTCWSGSVAPGDSVVLVPSQRPARLRSVQVHGADAAAASPGQRVALGLAGISREETGRGETVVSGNDGWEPTTSLDVEINHLADAARPLVTRSRVRLHLGTDEIIARVFPRDAAIEPGGRGMARLVLEAPTVARGGDRFVLRNFSPVETIGGGRVLDPLPPRRRSLWPGGLDSPDPATRLMALVRRRPHGAPCNQLAVLLGVSREQVRDAAGQGGYLEAGEHLVLSETVDALGAAARSTIQDFHRQRPAERGMVLAELKQVLKVPAWLATAAVDRLVGGGTLVVTDGIVTEAGFTPRHPGGNAQVARVIGLIERAGLTPPSLVELAEQIRMPNLEQALRLGAREGLLEPVERDRYFSRGALESFVAALRELGGEGLITPGRVRDKLGLSRKFLIPLLEWADRQGLTVRLDEGRRLRDGGQLPWQA